MLTPSEIYDAIEAHIEEINRVGELLDQGYVLLGETEIEWAEIRDNFLSDLVDDYAKKKERLPGEDVRESLCRRDNRSVWALMHKTKRAVDRMEKAVGREKAMLSARQSELSALKAEGAAPTRPPQPSWAGQS